MERTNMNKLDMIWKICCLLFFVFAPYGIKMDDYGDQDEKANWGGNAAADHLGRNYIIVDHHNGDGYQKEDQINGAESIFKNAVRICSEGVCKSITLKPNSPAKTTARSLLTLSEEEDDVGDLGSGGDDDSSSLSAGSTDGVNDCERDEDPSWFRPENSFSPCENPMMHLKNCGDICKKQESTVGRCLNKECHCCTMNDPLTGWFTSRAYLTPCRDTSLTEKTACAMGCSKQGAKKGTCVEDNCICSMEDLW